MNCNRFTSLSSCRRRNERAGNLVPFQCSGNKTAGFHALDEFAQECSSFIAATLRHSRGLLNGDDGPFARAQRRDPRPEKLDELARDADPAQPLRDGQGDMPKTNNGLQRAVRWQSCISG